MEERAAASAEPQLSWTDGTEVGSSGGGGSERKFRRSVDSQGCVSVCASFERAHQLGRSGQVLALQREHPAAAAHRQIINAAK